MRKTLYNIFISLIMLTSIQIYAISETSARKVVSVPKIQTVYQYDFLINTPTTETLSKGSYKFNFKFYRNGGIYNDASFAFLSKISLGYNFRINNVIGSNKPIFFSPPIDVHAKINITHENANIPAIAIGYNYQTTAAEPIQIDKKVYIVIGKTVNAKVNIKGFFGIYLSDLKNDFRPKTFLSFYKTFLHNKLGAILEYDDAFNFGLYSKDTNTGGRTSIGLKYAMTNNWIWSINMTTYYNNISDNFILDREFILSYQSQLF